MPDLRRPAGVVVAARKANAPFSGPPLEVGDVIYSVNRQAVAGVVQLREVLKNKKVEIRRCCWWNAVGTDLHSVTT